MDISKHENKGFDSDQMEQIRLGLMSNLWITR